MPQSIISRILTNVHQLTMRGGKAERVYLGAREWGEFESDVIERLPMQPALASRGGRYVWNGMEIIEVKLHDFLRVEGNETLTAAKDHLELLRERNDLSDALDALVKDRDQHEARATEYAREIVILREGMASATLECGQMAVEHDRLLTLLEGARDFVPAPLQAAISEKIDSATTVEID